MTGRGPGLGPAPQSGRLVSERNRVMQDKEISYYVMRRNEETVRSRDAATDEVRHIHAKFAMLYADRIDRLRAGTVIVAP